MKKTKNRKKHTVTTVAQNVLSYVKKKPTSACIAGRVGSWLAVSISSQRKPKPPFGNSQALMTVGVCFCSKQAQGSCHKDTDFQALAVLQCLIRRLPHEKSISLSTPPFIWLTLFLHKICVVIIHPPLLSRPTVILNCYCEQTIRVRVKLESLAVSSVEAHWNIDAVNK